MPDVYRALEVILSMEWSSKVDLWSVGAMLWDLLEGKILFHAKTDGVLDDEQHLAEMVSRICNPPPEFLCDAVKSARGSSTMRAIENSIPIPN
ncbi:protein kinase [Cordyceps fumosorosea ARSEF 2679]|uniref:Protein kinase n=1 Tax=Cordyceps fumosorosea (strain ARSEF 2679) TaxID=1081104 RepID=A0A162MPN2_CORFA|nr:protein kinase [Cordyceps fumosorosea ARSEF 2679]OAA64930.1 protein kinase [Cordyceps fumosorosea ARSEF 2679]